MALSFEELLEAFNATSVAEINEGGTDLFVEETAEA